MTTYRELARELASWDRKQHARPTIIGHDDHDTGHKTTEPDHHYDY